MAILKTAALKQDKGMVCAILLALIVSLAIGCYYFNTCNTNTTKDTDNDVIEYFFWKKKEKPHENKYGIPTTNELIKISDDRMEPSNSGTMGISTAPGIGKTNELIQQYKYIASLVDNYMRADKEAPKGPTRDKHMSFYRRLITDSLAKAHYKVRERIKHQLSLIGLR
jgi:hypothetical protein